MKNWKRMAGILVSAAMMVTLLSRCGTEDEYRKVENAYIVGVAAKSSSSEYWMSVNSGMEAAAAKYDMEVIFLSPDSERKNDVQEKLVEKLLERKVDALAISPINSYYVPDYMKEINRQGLPAVSFDTGFENKELPYIGINNKEMGFELAKTLAKLMQHNGAVGVVAGDLNQMGHRERTEGFLEYMKTEPNMTVEFVESGYANLQMSEQKVHGLMQQHPQVKGVLATSAVTGLGLAEEMSKNGIHIVTVDEQEDSLDALENGKISALAAQSGYEIGYETIRFLNDMRENRGDKEDYILDAQILTRENVEAFRREHENKKYSE